MRRGRNSSGRRRRPRGSPGDKDGLDDGDNVSNQVGEGHVKRKMR
jgi:hypothetical protein